MSWFEIYASICLTVFLFDHLQANYRYYFSGEKEKAQAKADAWCDRVAKVLNIHEERINIVIKVLEKMLEKKTKKNNGVENGGHDGRRPREGQRQEHERT